MMLMCTSSYVDIFLGKRNIEAIRSKPNRERLILNRHKTTQHEDYIRRLQPAVSEDSSDGKSGMTRNSTSSRDMMERYFLSDAVHSTAAAAYGPKDMLPHIDEWGWFVNTDTAAISSD